MNQTINRQPNNVYSKLVSFFLFLTIIAIFVVIHFALAKVHIKIYSNLETKEASVLVEMQAENSPEVSPEAILGKIITTELELSASVPSSQEVTNSDKAGGYVTIYNNYSKSQALVKTTRLLTPDNKLFRLSENITIAAGEKVKVWAEADGSGEEFVTGPTTFIIPGLWEGLQDKIYGETSEGMNLESIPAFTVSQANIDAAQEKIKLAAEEQSIAKINEIVGENLSINKNRLKFEFETISSSQIGEVSEETSITQKVTAHGLIFDEETLMNVAKEKFAKELNDGQILLNFDTNQISYSISEINLEKQEAILEIKTTITVSSSENKWDIDKSNLIGLDEQGLREYFKKYNPEKVEIKFSPFWVKTTPKLKDHIIIE